MIENDLGPSCRCTDPLQCPVPEITCFASMRMNFRSIKAGGPVGPLAHPPRGMGKMMIGNPQK